MKAGQRVERVRRLAAPSPRQVADAFGAQFDLLWEQRGDDRAIGAPVSWYKLRKRTIL